MAARKTTDSDLAGLDLGGVLGIISGAERVDPATLQRFVDRFAHFNFQDHMMRPSYGLAEATVFVATGAWSESSEAFHFDLGELSAGRAQRCSAGTGTELVKYKVPRSPRCGSSTPTQTASALRAWSARSGCMAPMSPTATGANRRRSSAASAQCSSTLRQGTPDGPWLRTGDQGFISEGELFTVGRIKDLLIIHGRNHYPEDIEATIQEITEGRAAAISVADGHTEKLVAIVELDKVGGSDEERTQKLRSVKREIISAISTSHSLRVADVVLVRLGTIPVTTSGKVRRSACVECYRHDEFRRLDVPADLLNET